MPKDKATRRAGREQFRNAAKEFGKSLLKKPDSEKRLETSSKPVVQNEMQKKYESSAHDLVKQESNVSAKDALDWEPIFPIDYELPKFKRISVKGCESANVRYILSNKVKVSIYISSVRKPLVLALGVLLSFATL